MTRVTRDPIYRSKVKGQGHQAVLSGCSSHNFQGRRQIVAAALEAAHLVPNLNEILFGQHFVSFHRVTSKTPILVV